jgi:peroxiredoxin
LADYRDHYDAIRAAGAELVAIAVDAPTQSEELRRELHLPFRILSDVDRSVVREWGVFNPRKRGGIAKPSVFILGSGREILFKSIDEVRTRVEAAEVVHALQAPTAKVPRRKRGYWPSLDDFIRAFRAMRPSRR